jgi:hypothetical protein
MVADLARSCYTRNMILVPGGPAVPVSWYFAKEGAKPFPFPHRFGSAIWDYTRGVPTTLGDQATSPMVWRNGSPLNTSGGLQFAGDPAFFRGEGPSSFTPLILAPDGTPVSCLSPSTFPSLAVLNKKGNSIDGPPAPPPTPVVCGSPGLSARTFTIKITGGTGFYVPFIGNTYILPMVLPGFIWQKQLIPGIYLEARCVGGKIEFCTFSGGFSDFVPLVSFYPFTGSGTAINNPPGSDCTGVCIIS